MKRISLALAILLIAAVANAQPVPTQQTAARADACTATNATAVVNTQVTLTLTPPSGKYVYLCGLDLTVSQDGTSTVATNLSWTSTNLGGWAYKYSLPATANIMLYQSFYWNIPVKSAAPGVAVTVVSPTNKANTAYSVNAYYYFAE